MSGNESIVASLLKPGWDAAEIVLPVLHKCLAALLAILIYTAQHSEKHVAVHLYVMIGLTIGLWGSITWFVGEYRKCLAVPPSESSASDNGAMSEPINDDKTVTDKMPAVPLPPSTHNKELRYTD